MPILILSNSYKDICSYKLFGSVVNTTLAVWSFLFHSKRHTIHPTLGWFLHKILTLSLIPVLFGFEQDNPVQISSQQDLE